MEFIDLRPQAKKLEKHINSLIIKTEKKHNVLILIAFKPQEDPPIKVTFVVRVESHL
ncbi:hypothetical protein ACHRV6_23385 [Flavobacterium sp. FlaQc-51]|uniref:hypothetical protein n=1 Tax=Flavobacterium sp. FlaQc-51 TaxID=3374184 RepID=UPI0037583AA9